MKNEKQMIEDYILSMKKLNNEPEEIQSLQINFQQSLNI